MAKEQMEEDLEKKVNKETLIEELEFLKNSAIFNNNSGGDSQNQDQLGLSKE